MDIMKKQITLGIIRLDYNYPPIKGDIDHPDSFTYDVIYRVIPGFMAQTGDPKGNGTGGSGQKLKAEFSDYQYTSGTVGMARTMDPNTGDSQFFICFDGCGHLTGQYTAWGQVETGMDVVENINVGEPPSNPDKIINASISE